MKQPLHGFVSHVPGEDMIPATLQEPDSTGTYNTFRFMTFNVPNLLRLESNSTNSSEISIPNRYEVWNQLCSIQQLGGKVLLTKIDQF